MVFYLAIVLYITSVITALVLMITGKRMSPGRFLLLAGIHLCFIGLYFLTNQQEGPEPHFSYSFLLFICSGTALSGLVWRITVPRMLKVYFSIFVLSFPLFLFSPSMLVNFLLTTKYSDTLGKTFCVKDRLYLEQQQAWRDLKGMTPYKLVERRGIFRKTIVRDLDFGGRIDSARTLSFIADSLAEVRGYRIRETYVSTQTDSIDLTIDLRPKTNARIERRLTP